MTDQEIEYLNTYRRCRDFGIKNAADFPLNSAGDLNFKIFAPEIAKVEKSGEIQASGIGREATVSKETAAAEVLEDMREINRTARAIGVDQPEIAALFRMHHDRAYQKLLSAAMAFHTNSAAPTEQLLLDYGMPADFRADLQSDIDDLQAAITGQNLTKDKQTGATGAVAASLQLMNEALRRLRGIVRNVYRHNPEKLAAWTSASHVERPPKKKQTGENEDEEPES